MPGSSQPTVGRVPCNLAGRACGPSLPRLDDRITDLASRTAQHANDDNQLEWRRIVDSKLAGDFVWLAHGALSVITCVGTALFVSIYMIGPVLILEFAAFFFYSPAVVANLWDVTDRSIDRLTKHMLSTWGMLKQTAQNKSIVQAVAKSRSKCKLSYLIGAAPVVYGIPVYLEPYST